MKSVRLFIYPIFPFLGSELKHENQGILSYYIPSKDNSWGKVIVEIMPF